MPPLEWKPLREAHAGRGRRSCPALPNARQAADDLVQSSRAGQNRRGLAGGGSSPSGGEVGFPVLGRGRGDLRQVAQAPVQLQRCGPARPASAGPRPSGPTAPSPRAARRSAQECAPACGRAAPRCWPADRNRVLSSWATLATRIPAQLLLAVRSPAIWSKAAASSRSSAGAPATHRPGPAGRPGPAPGRPGDPLGDQHRHQ